MAIVNRNQTRKVYSFKSAGSTKRSSDNTPVAKHQKPPKMELNTLNDIRKIFQNIENDTQRKNIYNIQS